MTALAFIFGCLPLWMATGSGAASRRILGTVVIGGMTLSTVARPHLHSGHVRRRRVPLPPLRAGRQRNHDGFDLRPRTPHAASRPGVGRAQTEGGQA